MERKNIWSTYNASQLTELHEINEKYKRCLDEGKTERECVNLTIQMAKAAGYQDLKEVMCAHPDYRVAQRNIKKKENKKTFAGLTYEYMRDYLILHTSPEEEAEAVAELDEMILIARCHTPNFSYATIKKWFLRKFPEVAEFGTIEAEYKAQFAI